MGPSHALMYFSTGLALCYLHNQGQQKYFCYKVFNEQIETRATLTILSFLTRYKCASVWGRWHSTLHIISSICEQPRHTVALVVAVAFYALKKYSCSSIPRGPGYLCLPNSIYLSFVLHRSQSSVFTHSKFKLSSKKPMNCKISSLMLIDKPLETNRQSF